MSITEEERESIERDKPLVELLVIEELDGFLERLPESPRYIILSGLQVAQFLTSTPFPPQDLKELTLEELVQGGAVSFVLMDGVTNEHVLDLNSMLASLVDGSDELIDHPGRIKREESDSEEDIPSYSSIESERLLNECYDKVQKLSSYDQIRDRKIGDDWSKIDVVENVPAAPFIEALRYKELFNIPVSNLLKKRLMTDKKVYCLISLLQSNFIEDNKKDIPKKGILPKSVADLLIRFIKKLSS